MSKRARTSWTLAAAAVAVVVVGFWLTNSATPKRFGVVVPDRLYRCGDITPHQLAHVVQEHGVRTVLSLLNPDVSRSHTEKAAAEKLGLRWVNIPLTGDGASTPADREKIKTVLFDETAAPLLVHCAAGANRTGLAVGMYRIHKQGWDPKRVLAEMRSYGFEDLPKHENLRQALQAEWLIAAGGGAGPGDRP